jgi:hypothetical protein
MKTLIAVALIVTTLAPPAFAEMSREQLLKNTYEMRLRFERDQAGANRSSGVQSEVAQGTTANPTVTAMRTEVKNDIRNITTSNVCRKLNVSNAGGNTTVICGANSGVIESEHTTADRDIITIGGQP